MPARLMDSNILLRYFTRDDEEKAARALALLQRVEQGEERVEISLPVVFETVYTLQRYYRVPREKIHQLLSNIIRMRGVHLPGKDLCKAALLLYVQEHISFADAYNAAYAGDHGIEIYSWDTDFDKVEGVVRVEPAESK